MSRSLGSVEPNRRGQEGWFRTEGRREGVHLGMGAGRGQGPSANVGSPDASKQVLGGACDRTTMVALEERTSASSVPAELIDGYVHAGAEENKSVHRLAKLVS